MNLTKKAKKRITYNEHQQLNGMSYDTLINLMADFTTQILSSELEELQQENKRLEEENEQIENGLNALTNLYGIRVNRHDDTESELQQTKAQLEECLNVLDMVKQSTNDFGLIGDINKLLTNIK